MFNKIPIFSMFASLVFLLALFILGTEAGAEIYRYVDKDGTTNFSDTPMDGGKRYSVKKAVYRSGRRGGRYTISSRSAMYNDIVRSAAAKTGLDPKLIKSVIQTESAWNHRAISKAGAMGLMQLMPPTARKYKVKNLFDARQNVMGGSQYLKDLLLRYRGDLTLTLAAYNAGESAVSKYAGVPPYRETRLYVKKVLRLYRGGVVTAKRKRAERRIYSYRDSNGNRVITDTPRADLASY